MQRRAQKLQHPYVRELFTSPLLYRGSYCIGTSVIMPQSVFKIVFVICVNLIHLEGNTITDRLIMPQQTCSFFYRIQGSAFLRASRQSLFSLCSKCLSKRIQHKSWKLRISAHRPSAAQTRLMSMFGGFGTAPSHGSRSPVVAHHPTLMIRKTKASHHRSAID